MIFGVSYETLSEAEDGVEVDSLPDLEPDPLQNQVLPHENIDNDERECWVCFLSESETPDSGIKCFTEFIGLDSSIS